MRSSNAVLRLSIALLLLAIAASACKRSHPEERGFCVKPHGPFAFDGVLDKRGVGIVVVKYLDGCKVDDCRDVEISFIGFDGLHVLEPERPIRIAAVGNGQRTEIPVKFAPGPGLSRLGVYVKSPGKIPEGRVFDVGTKNAEQLIVDRCVGAGRIGGTQAIYPELSCTGPGSGKGRSAPIDPITLSADLMADGGWVSVSSYADVADVVVDVTGVGGLRLGGRTRERMDTLKCGQKTSFTICYDPGPGRAGIEVSVTAPYRGGVWSYRKVFYVGERPSWLSAPQPPSAGVPPAAFGSAPSPPPQIWIPPASPGP